MTFTPASKCQKCSLYSEAGNFCDHLSNQELQNLSSESRTATLKRGETIAGEALKTWPVVAIASGVLSMQHLLEDGRKTIAAFFMQGDIIDLRGISNRNRGHLIALKNTDICRLSPIAFEGIMLSNAGAQHMVWGNLREQAYRAIDHSADLAKKKALEKLASFIFECRHRQIEFEIGGDVHIPVRRVDLAEYLGMQPETVSRCFRILEERDIIDFVSISQIKIRSVPVLRRIANGENTAVNVHQAEEDHFKVLSFG